MSKRLAMQMAFRGRSSLLVPNKSAIFSARLGMTNKYAHDYACEDEYFEREMTLLDAKLLPLPIPDDYRHKIINQIHVLNNENHLVENADKEYLYNVLKENALSLKFFWGDGEPDIL